MDDHLPVPVGTKNITPTDSIYYQLRYDFALGTQTGDTHREEHGNIEQLHADLDAVEERGKHLVLLLRGLWESRFKLMDLTITRAKGYVGIDFAYLGPSGRPYRLRYMKDDHPLDLIPDDFLYDLGKLSSRNQ